MGIATGTAGAAAGRESTARQRPRPLRCAGGGRLYRWWPTALPRLRVAWQRGCRVVEYATIFRHRQAGGGRPLLASSTFRARLPSGWRVQNRAYPLRVRIIVLRTACAPHVARMALRIRLNLRSRSCAHCTAWPRICRGRGCTERSRVARVTSERTGAYTQMRRRADAVLRWNSCTASPRRRDLHPGNVRRPVWSLPGAHRALHSNRPGLPPD